MGNLEYLQCWDVIVFCGCCVSVRVREQPVWECARARWAKRQRKVCMSELNTDRLKRVHLQKTWWVCNTNSLSGAFPRLKNDLGTVLRPAVAALSMTCELISGQMACGDWRFLPHWGEASCYPDVDVFRLYYEEVLAKISAWLMILYHDVLC